LGLRQAATYPWVSDSGVGLEFLGHFTKGKYGRVVCFAEWVEGARVAGPGDMDGCKKALGRLHELDVKLGYLTELGLQIDCSALCSLPPY
jgi:hypothetical protein